MKPKAQPVVVSVQVSAQSNQPTAEEALEWLAESRMDVTFVEDDVWHIIEPRFMQAAHLAVGTTPLEAIRNAMKACAE